MHTTTPNFLGKPPAEQHIILLLLFRSPLDKITQDAYHRLGLDWSSR